MLSRYICIYTSTTVIIILLMIGIIEFTKMNNTIRKGICSVNSNGTNEINIIWNLDNYSGNMTLTLTQILINFINNGCYIKRDFNACPCWLTTNNPNYINLGNDSDPDWKVMIIICTIILFITTGSIMAYTIREFQNKMRCCYTEYKNII